MNKSIISFLLVVALALTQGAPKPDSSDSNVASKLNVDTQVVDDALSETTKKLLPATADSLSQLLATAPQTAGGVANTLATLLNSLSSASPATSDVARILQSISPVGQRQQGQNGQLYTVVNGQLFAVTPVKPAVVSGSNDSSSTAAAQAQAFALTPVSQPIIYNDGLGGITGGLSHILTSSLDGSQNILGFNNGGLQRGSLLGGGILGGQLLGSNLQLLGGRGGIPILGGIGIQSLPLLGNVLGATAQVNTAAASVAATAGNAAKKP